jgi:pimeloyl-ACP methyl ester carboxylesterase
LRPRPVSLDIHATQSALLSNAHIVTLPAAAHVPQMEQPEAFTAATLSFLQGKD